MNNQELGNILRSTCMLVSIVLRAQGKSADIDEAARKTIEGLQRDAKAALYDLTIPFGAERLLPNASFEEMLAGFGKLKMSFEQQRKTLPEAYQNLFAIEMSYRPVEAPTGFGALPDRAVNMLGQHVEARLARNYDRGMEDLTRRMWSAVHFYRDKAKVYHEFMVNPGSRRVILRDVTVTNLVSCINLMARVNVMQNPRYENIVEALVNVRQVTIDQIRSDSRIRENTVNALGGVIELMRGTVTPDTTLPAVEEEAAA